MKIWAGRVFGRVAGLDEETHGERSATSLLLSCTSSQFYWVFSYSLKKSKSNLFWTFELFNSFDLDLFKDFDLWTSIGSLPGWPNSWSHGDGPDAHRHSMTIRYHNEKKVSSDLTYQDMWRQTTKRFKMVQERKMEDARKFCKTAKSIFGACKPELKTLGSCFWNSSSWAWWQIMRTKFPRLQIASCMYLLPFHFSNDRHGHHAGL